MTSKQSSRWHQSISPMRLHRLTIVAFALGRTV